MVNHGARDMRPSSLAGRENDDYNGIGYVEMCKTFEREHACFFVTTFDIVEFPIT